MVVCTVSLGAGAGAVYVVAEDASWDSVVVSLVQPANTTDAETTRNAVNSFMVI
jgi:hypothetical protein